MSSPDLASVRHERARLSHNARFPDYCRADRAHLSHNQLRPRDGIVGKMPTRWSIGEKSPSLTSPSLTMSAVSFGCLRLQRSIRLMGADIVMESLHS